MQLNCTSNLTPRLKFVQSFYLAIVTATPVPFETEQTMAYFLLEFCCSFSSDENVRLSDACLGIEANQNISGRIEPLCATLFWCALATFCMQKLYVSHNNRKKHCFA